ncbi:MAG: DUF6297 family protein [Micrococcales bacterium]|nr:DUF6297 family protein [Micrococcales bacterium]
MIDEWHNQTPEVVGLDGCPAVAEAELGDVPRAGAIRRYTRDATKQRAGAGLGSLLSDVYYAVVVLAIGIAVGVGVAGQLKGSVPDVERAGGTDLIPTLVAVLIGSLAATVVSLAGRLGPVGAGGAEAAWWLGLPVDRRGLLRPATRRLPLVAAGVGGLVVALLDGGLLGDPMERTVRAGVSGALAAGTVVLVMSLAQTFGASRRFGALAGDVMLVVVPVALGFAAWVGVTPDKLPVPSWVVLAGVGLVVGGLAWAADARLTRIRASSLRESGSVAAQAVGAMVSMDSRELGRALSDGAATSSRPWASRLRTIRGPVNPLVTAERMVFPLDAGLPHGLERSAVTGLVTADLVLLRRSLRHMVQVLLAIALPVVATVVPQLSGQGPVLVAVLVGGYVAASASAEGSRRAEMAPILDRLLPLDPTMARRARMIVPGAVMTVWAVAVFVAVGTWLGDIPSWAVLGLAGVPAWAAAAVRAAYRPAPDWGATLVSTPFGALPSGVGAVLSRGPDIVVLALLPTWIALVLGHTTQMLGIAQAVTSFIAILVASSTSTKTFSERMLDAQKEAEKKQREAAAGR